MFLVCAGPRGAAVGTRNASSTRNYDNGTSSLEATWAQKVICPLGAFICLGGLGGNGLLLGLLGFLVKWGDFTVFIFHLSVADFLYLSSQSVYFTQKILAAFHSIQFRVRYIAILTDISYMAGLCLLTAISVWRCLSVLHPIWCRLHAPQHAPAAVCSLIWVLSVSANVHRFLVCRTRRFCNGPSCNMHGLVRPAFFCVLLSVTVVCTLVVLVKVRCGTQRRPPLKLYVTVLLTVLFLLCAFPFGFRMYFSHVNVYFEIRLLLLLLSCVNSSANPLVYYFVGRVGGRGRRGNLREVFQKALGEESAPSRGSSTGTSTAQCEEGEGMRAGTEM